MLHPASKKVEKIVQETTNWSALPQSLGKTWRQVLLEHSSVYMKEKVIRSNQHRIAKDNSQLTQLIAFYDKNGWISGWGENSGCHLFTLSSVRLLALFPSFKAFKSLSECPGLNWGLTMLWRGDWTRDLLSSLPAWDILQSSAGSCSTRGLRSDMGWIILLQCL